jgi:hypothetical protein
MDVRCGVEITHFESEAFFTDIHRAQPHLPTQAMKFIDGLDIEVDFYWQLMAHCKNSQSVFGVDVYATTLPDALHFSSKYMQLAAAKVEKPEIAIDPIPGAIAFVTCETPGKQMEK